MTSWQELRDEAAGCTRCDLCQRATQTVFGEGRTRVSIALVGEQPGDQEDKLGHPFVGPAGRVLDRALGEAGLDRDGVYMTNAVKRCGGGGPMTRGSVPSDGRDDGLARTDSAID